MSTSNYNDDTRGMHRIPDHDTSIASAEAVQPVALGLRNLIHRLLLTEGDMTDEGIADVLRTLGFDLAESTPRKRRGELVEAGRVIDTGRVERNRRGRNMVIWHGLADGELPMPVEPKYEAPVPKYPAGTPGYEAFRVALDVELGKFARREAPYDVHELDTGGVVPPYITDRIAGHEGDQP